MFSLETQGSGHSVSRPDSSWELRRRMHGSDCSASHGGLCSLTWVEPSSRSSPPLVVGSQVSLPCTCKDNCGCKSGSEIIQGTSSSEAFITESTRPWKATPTGPMVNGGYPETEAISILFSSVPQPLPLLFTSYRNLCTQTHMSACIHTYVEKAQNPALKRMRPIRIGAITLARRVRFLVTL